MKVVKVENEDIENPIKLVRVIFRTFDPKLSIKKHGIKNYLNIKLTKLFTTPLTYDGPYKYDHNEILTPKRQRFSIRMEDENLPVTGVYLINRNGFWDDKNQELLDQRYKLVFAFEVTDEQEEKLNEFIKAHKGEHYGLKNANWNFLMNKINKYVCGFNTEKWMIDDFYINTKKKKRMKWDCVTLAMRTLLEVGLIPEFRGNGKKVNLLGLSSFDMAMLLLEMYKDGELLQCKYVISRELLDLKEYKKGLKLFYERGCKITRGENI